MPLRRLAVAARVCYVLSSRCSCSSRAGIASLSESRSVWGRIGSGMRRVQRGHVVCPDHTQIRTKKTRRVVRLEDLPQGLIPSPGEAALPPLPPLEGSEHSGPAYPTVVLQARRHMQKFDNCVLLTRVGGFYELYFEHADEFGPLLNLKVAQKKTRAGPVSMAGFPFFQLDRFLKTLVQDLNRYVAIAEEFPIDASQKTKSGDLDYDRRVARIITPGTLIDEKFMDPYANNYVMAIHLPKTGGVSVEGNSNAEALHPTSDATGSCVPIGVAWLDLSTGSFSTESTTLSSLSSVLSRVSPRELVLDSELQARGDHGVFSVLGEDKHLITYSPPGDLQSISDWAPVLEADLPADAAANFTDDEVKAGNLLLHYVKDRLQGLSMKLQLPRRYESMQVMTIEKTTMRSLEIKQTIRDNVFRGSLLHAVRRTVTRSGARLLNEWLSAPSTSLDIINARLDLVGRFYQDEDLCDKIITLLKRTHDSQRLVQKFALNRGLPDDLLRLASTIEATADIVKQLRDSVSRLAMPDCEEHCFAAMISRISLEQPLKLASKIRNSIDEESVEQQHQLEDGEADAMLALALETVKKEGSNEEDGVGLLPSKAARTRKRAMSLHDYYGVENVNWAMKPRASTLLKRLHKELDGLLEEKPRLTDVLRERLTTPSLTLRWTPGLGYICHVKGKDARNAASGDAPPALSSSRSTRSFLQPEWTALGARLHSTRLQIQGEEKRVFAALRTHVVQSLVRLRRNAAVLAELDIATSQAKLARDKGLTRPLVRPSGAGTLIVGGRHPTVEGGLAERGRDFTRNDCFVGAAGHGRVWLLTGPNMAGKSTFLRQCALAHVLAQAGCWVPADHAELGIVDALFARVGSADDLYRDQSTFMVEMLEAAAILRHATPRSFVIMDEIGRGTTPADGTAVAFAALHHLIRLNRCRALFATHFHDVADLVTEHRMRLEDGGDDGQVDMYCTDLEEDGNGNFVYIHKLHKGINRRSHALKVARLAGLPEEAIQVAQEALDRDARPEPTFS